MSLANQDYVMRDIDLPQQPPHFLKVNADCWERVFDYLSLCDILAVSETCKRMRHLGRYYFHENVPECCGVLQNRFSVHFEAFAGANYCQSCERFENDFKDFVRILFVGEHLDHFLNSNSFCFVNTLVLHWIELTEVRIEYIKNLLANVEHIQLEGCSIYGDYYETFLQFCTKLKSLNIRDVYLPSAVADSIFRWRHPTINCIEWTGLELLPGCKEIPILLKRNPNIKEFKISANWLWTNRKLLVDSNIRLDCLCVCVSSGNDTIPVNEFVQLLRTFYESGFYKSLNLSIVMSFGTDDDMDDGYQECINGLSSLKAFEKLTIRRNIDLSQLTHLKQLYFSGLRNTATDMEALATNLTQLERIIFHCASTDDILPFVQQSKFLRMMKVGEFVGGGLIRGDILNLCVLNEERKKFGNTRTVFIYVLEKIHMATKWSTKHLNLTLVETARETSFVFGKHLMK